MEPSTLQAFFTKTVFEVNAYKKQPITFIYSYFGSQNKRIIEH